MLASDDRVSILSEEAVLANEINADEARAERDAAAPDSIAWHFADAKVRATE